ncbi:MAG: acylneuraminate cytidylyltransferase family protein [Proteobacteria bacterium]|nr:acylneuraminate cytidylyltransferase family protein [Pseudomonadota bacterium]MBU1639419.1 acylneuraminate cytidylyltransferase family protein [Pseudomonadota bacterium]
MIDGKKVLAIIPARGGSKGLPRKNLLEVNGKPLLAWTITEGLKSRFIDRLILSSEDQEIIETAKKWGCEAPFARPQELATDEATTTDVVLHALAELEDMYDYIVLLQPTSPLRSHHDIDSCIEECHNRKATSCVTVSAAEKSPFWMYFLNADHHMQAVIDTTDRPTRRQELPIAYALNGAVYVVNRAWFQQTGCFTSEDTIAHIMPKERSLDIDTELDFTIFRWLATTSRNS